MQEDLRKEILEAFPNTRILFDSEFENLNYLYPAKSDDGKYITLPQKFDPLLVLFDEKNLYCITKYDNLSYNELKNNFELLKKFYRPLKNIDFAQLFEDCKTEYNPDNTLCLMHLFLDIYPKFNKFHLGNQNSLKEPRLFHCSIICEKNNWETLRKTLRTLYADMKLQTNFEKIKTTQLKNHTIASIDIVTFYWIVDIDRFMAYKNKGIIEWK